MQIQEQTWVNYVMKLRRVDETAAQKMRTYLSTHNVRTAEGTRAAIDYGYALATEYGEGAAELACEMYDAIGVASGKSLAAAIPAETATYDEVAKAINGTINSVVAEELTSAAVGRLVKMASADTMIHNSLRDGAEFAWVPHGDTCPYCLMLASRGWQRASKQAIRNGHAEHIHANCDCTYCVRFDSDTQVRGYNPGKYEDMYYDAEGVSYRNRVNYMRREQYAENKDAINARKRELYRLHREAKEK